MGERILQDHTRNTDVWYELHTKSILDRITEFVGTSQPTGRIIRYPLYPL